MMTNEARGRNAAKPTELPASGWKDILWRVYAEISDDRVMLVAAGVTYYLLLAMIPALSAMVSVYGLFADPATIQQQMNALSGVVPGGGLQIIDQQLTRLTHQASGTLGLTLMISLAIALWSTNSGVKALFQAMNVAYDEHERRGFFKLTLISFAFTLVAIVGVILSIGVIVGIPVVLSSLDLGVTAVWIVRIASYLIIAIFVSLAVAGLYRWGPSRRSAQWRWVTPGVALSVLFIVVVSILFSWYVSNFGSYNATYGSLGALIGFLTWIWLSVTILIVGGEFNSEMEHQTARDTTVGPDRPMGERMAQMADHVAAGYENASHPGKSEKDSDPIRSQTKRKRIPFGTLAFAVSAALLLSAMQRGSRKR